MIIGIAGTLGAGKGTVVECLKKKGFAHYSVSGYLGEILEERGLPKKREHLSALADELANTYNGGVLEVIHTRAEKENVTDYILESIHRVSEAEYIRSIGGTILAVDADPKIRYSRTQQRQEGEKDSVTYEEFFAAMKREEHGEGNGMPNINAVVAGADFTILNNGSMEELQSQVDAFYQEHHD